MDTPRSSTALLVIDMQEEVLEGCTGAAEIIARINDLSRRADEAGVPVILIQHEGDDELVKGTPGWRLAEALERRNGAIVFPKTFRDGFAATDLQALLERLGVRRVVVTGAHSDFCVQTTALSALVHGFDLVFVSDGHTTVPSQEDPALSGAALTALINARMATLRYPDRTIEVLPAAEVAL